MTSLSAVSTHAEGPGVARPPAGTYRIDPAHSTVTFTTTHMFGLGRVRGSLTLTGGEIHVADPLGASTARAAIAAASFRTGSGQRDRHVRSRALLDVATHPEISFVLRDLRERDGGDWTARGSLTAHGVSAPVELSVDRVEATTDGALFHALTRVDRRQFGVTRFRGMAGRYLDIALQIVARTLS
jgi:polyisoprenoid-binding protein YceI